MTDKPTVIEAILKVMDGVQSVRKTGRNTEQNYSFRGIDEVVNAVGPKLREHGVVVMPMLEQASYRDVQTSRGKPSRESTVQVRYRFHGPAGDHLDAVVPGEAMDFGDKGVAKAMSVAYRIALLQALCIPTDDPEPDAATYERDVAPPDPSPADIAGFVDAIYQTSDLPALRTLWQRIAGSGLLEVEGTDRTGEPATLHALLERRAKEIGEADKKDGEPSAGA